MDRRRALLAASMQSGGNEEVKVIKFYVYDDYTGEITQYEAMSNMTWEQWIDSDYNPYLPDNSQKRFSKTSYLGKYSGYVWYHLWDEEYEQIDNTVEIVVRNTSPHLTDLKDKIIENAQYEAS